MTVKLSNVLSNFGEPRSYLETRTLGKNTLGVCFCSFDVLLLRTKSLWNCSLRVYQRILRGHDARRVKKLASRKLDRVGKRSL